MEGCAPAQPRVNPQTVLRDCNTVAQEGNPPVSPGWKSLHPSLSPNPRRRTAAYPVQSEPTNLEGCAPAQPCVNPKTVLRDCYTVAQEGNPPLSQGLTLLHSTLNPNPRIGTHGGIYALHSMQLWVSVVEISVKPCRL